MKINLPFIFILICSQIFGQQNFQDLKYRLIGPFRAGRTVGAVGIPTQPNVFFMGVNNGGVWKTDDYGRTWNPIFDKAPTGSVGDIAVSPNNPNVIYVGTGEGLHRPDLAVGDGMFKSNDGGTTWKHIGLGEVQQIARVIVHPKDPDIVYVAGMGHPYGANEMRGVFKTKDGGGSWEKVLYINHNTGASQVEIDPNNPKIIYASMWEHQEGPWENAKFTGPNSGLFKSKNSGKTWTKLTRGLPDHNDNLGRIGIAIAPGNSKRLYATVEASTQGGVYRSDDGGESWKLINNDYRVWGRASDFAELKVHPKNPDIVFSGNIASYKSMDGGITWMSLKGAPGGDDYHRIWINPLHPEIMLFAADQGATITVNNGKTWSSWYNQPTSQLYHVTTDNQFPYWVYGGQQESGAIGIASRGNGGQISFRDWMGVGADEYAYVAPDPKDPNIVYGGRVVKFNKKTGQSQLVAPEILRSGKTRFIRTMPLMFHPADDHTLLFGTNILWQTQNGGKSWKEISPDLTRKKPNVPESVGDFYDAKYEDMAQRAIIYALGPSPLNRNIIWAGTDDGLVQVTVDGGNTWKDVTPSAMTSWDKVSQIDAGHFNQGTAYIAINAIRKDNMHPLIYKTHDMGESWELVVDGMNENGPVNTVREDVKQPGLLFAGTEREVYYSSNDGEGWQSLRLNMPATSVRDLVVHENDLVIGTHGRSIWILDDINPLRHIKETTQTGKAILLPPNMATRVRDNMFSDTPLPPEEPTGTNPPDGAILDYILPQRVQSVVIEIIDDYGKIIQEFSSDDIHPEIDTTTLAHPTYWMKPQQKVSTEAGHHRLIWDLRYKEPKGVQKSFSIAAVYRNTPSGPKGPYVHPGVYKVKLTTDNHTSTESLIVRLDPRVDISNHDLQLQTELSLDCYDNYHNLQSLIEDIDTKLGVHSITEQEKNRLWKLRGTGVPGDGDFLYGSISETALDKETIVDLQSKLLHMLVVLQSSESRPTDAAILAVDKLGKRVVEIIGKSK
jgi:photosystem II stability/assembly factor-like uncharacterized protein